MLSENLHELHRLAGALLEYETLTGEESKRVIAGDPSGRDEGGHRRPVATSSGGSSIPKSKRPGGGWGEAAPQGA